MVDYRGWTDPVGKLLALQVAIKHLISRNANFRDRMEKVTLPFAVMSPDEFPERIRETARKVLAVRAEVAAHLPHAAFWDFGRLNQKERKELVDGIIDLYEACLIDLGRMGEDYDFIYPEDRADKRS